MEMKIVMSKREAQQLLVDALRPKLGAVQFKVETVDWPSYSDKVTFDLDSVEPEIAPIQPAPPPADDIPY